MLKGRLPLSPAVVVKGLGSGVIIDRDGYIVTNYHVVNDASDLAVALADGNLQLTRIVGVDTESDIALLKIDAEDLRPIALTDIDEVSVGDDALVVLVDPDGPADHAGIAPGDVIVRVGERLVSRPTDVRSVVVGAEPETHVPVEFVRKSARATVDVTLLPVPAQQATRWRAEEVSHNTDESATFC